MHEQLYRCSEGTLAEVGRWVLPLWDAFPGEMSKCFDELSILEQH